MALLTGVVLASVGAFVFACGLFALQSALVRSAEHRLVAALAFTCAGMGLLERDSLLARLLVLLAFGFVARLSLRTLPSVRAPRVVAAVQGVLAATALVEVWRRAPAPRLFALASLFGVIAAVLLLASASRSYLAGRKDMAGVVFGAGVLMVTAAHDAVSEARLASPGSLVPLGFLGLVSGWGTKLCVEYADTRRRLEVRKRELRTRTRELRHSHHELQATQAELGAKEQLAAVGELAAVVAHEIRNPLAILANAVSSLRKDALPVDDRKTLLEIIDSEATRLNRIVTDLLSFSRPITVQRTSVDIGDLVERALHLSVRRADVSVDLQLSGAARAWADGNLLRQVFDNLIENAMQAMERGGTLTLRVGTDAASENATVEIVDTGEGMDTQVRRRAKDPFFTTRPSGTGLGLAIVDRIVEAHGGQLEIESRAGQGTKVTVHLPRGLARRRDPGEEEPHA